MKSSDPEFFEKLQNYYVEFLSLSPGYQAAMEGEYELLLENERKPLPDIPILADHWRDTGCRIGKFKVLTKERIVQDITDKCRCESSSFVGSNCIKLEVKIERPIEEIIEQLKNLISKIQEDHWKKMEDENCFGEYRYLLDFKRIKKGRKLDKKDYPFKLWERYIMAYKFRQQVPKLKYREIGKILFPDHDIDDAKTKAFQAVEKAKLLIKAAEENKFPP